MRHSFLRLCTGVSRGARPHLHQSPCVVCDAAEAAYLIGSETNSAATQSCSSNNAATTSTLKSTKACPSSSSKLHAKSAATSSPLTSSRSLVELRRDDLLQWFKTVSTGALLNPSMNNDGSGTNFLPLLKNSEEFEAYYNAYLRCDNAEVEGNYYETLLRSLDQQCRRINVPKKPAEQSSSSVIHSSIRIPSHLVVQFVDAGTAAEDTSAHPRSSHSEPKQTNIFEAHVRQLFPSDSAAVAKQLAFQEALLSIREVLDEQGIEFFLACGTALGARRNGCFIPYDEDIDLGILYSELSLCPSTGASEGSSSGSFPPASSLQKAQERLFRLIDALTATGIFLIFDVCGAVEKGLELRVLHTPTNTRIDINVYYPPVPGSDDTLMQAEGPFLWAASFYEAAAQRAHQMYRYRHQPFDKERMRVPFCVRTPDTEGFWVPPERYLVENYGVDWQTPKQYTYTEGLTKEFKNIIDE